jgi:hypothetical protein
MWLSADPALGDYIPSAPVNEEARERNGKLPGMDGVFNTINLHLYHYAGNNPVKYTDPDGKAGEVFHGGKYPGWSDGALQTVFGYVDWMDDAAPLLGFNINGTKLDFDGETLRLWKGDYGEIGRVLALRKGIPFMGGTGGEIGLYNTDGSMMRGDQLSAIGLEGTTMQLFDKDTRNLIAEYDETGPSGWTTAFNAKHAERKEDMFSVNTLKFKSESQAKSFANGISASITRGEKYRHNGNESITVIQKGRNVAVIWGQE